MTADAWRITGGQPLRGTVRPAGSKNGALPVLAATLLLDGETVLDNVPRIADVATMIHLLQALGLRVEAEGQNTLRIVNSGITTAHPPKELVRKMRASHYLLGPLCTQLGRAEFPLPGGCDIGDRPIGYIVDGLSALGVKAELADGTLRCVAPRLAGATVTLDPAYRSAGATFNVLMAAAKAPGTTILDNASCEPDVVGFCHFLNAAGACIEGIGTGTLTISGVDRLAGAVHRVNADRLEAGTFICAAAATRGEVTVENMTTAELGETADKLEEAGVEIRAREGCIVAGCPSRPRAVDIVTHPFPAFSTDLQPPVAAVLATAEGTSTIHETVFDRRLQYGEQLAKMGADMEARDSRHAVIRGVERLTGATVAAGNIREGAALVIAALSADGESVVSGRRFVERGYEDLEGKLRALGADMMPVE